MMLFLSKKYIVICYFKKNKEEKEKVLFKEEKAHFIASWQMNYIISPWNVKFHSSWRPAGLDNDYGTTHLAMEKHQA